MTLKLFHAWGSCSLASLIALEEADADYELVTMNTKAGESGVGVGERSAVPSLRPLDGAETSTLFRPRHDDRRPVGRRGGSAERGVDLLQVVSVDFERLPGFPTT